MLSRYQVLVLQGIMLIIFRLNKASLSGSEKEWIEQTNIIIQNKERG